MPPAAKRLQQMCACCEQLRTQLQSWQAEASNAQQLLNACECHVTAREPNAQCSKLEHALSQCNVALEATTLSIASKQASMLQQASSATEVQTMQAWLVESKAVLCTCRSRKQQHAERVKAVSAQELCKHKLAAERHDAQHATIDALERAEYAGVRTLVCMLATAAPNEHRHICMIAIGVLCGHQPKLHQHAYKCRALSIGHMCADRGLDKVAATVGKRAMLSATPPPAASMKLVRRRLLQPFAASIVAARVLQAAKQPMLQTPSARCHKLTSVSGGNSALAA